MTTNRLETFSDGVFAIAATLLVLNFHVPATTANLGSFLLNLWPDFVAYGTSFLLIGLVWANHHSMFLHVVHVNRMMLFLNVLLLANVAFLPFPTDLLAQALGTYHDVRTAAFFYGLTLTVGGVFFNGLWLYISRSKLLANTRTPRSFIRRMTVRFLVGPLSYGVATSIALFVPAVAIVSYVLLIVYYWLPPKDEERLMIVGKRFNV